MVTIVGNVKPEDDYTHPLGPEENFNESVYFNFFDRAKQMGGFLRIGNRANEGHAEMTVIVYQPDGSALFNYKRPQISNNDGWDAGGLKVEVIVPGEKIRTTYEGRVVYLADPRAMRDPRVAFKENPHKRIKLDLDPRGVGPLYGHVAEPEQRKRKRIRPRPLRAAHEGPWHAPGRGWVDARDLGATACATTPGARATGSRRPPTAGSRAITATISAWLSRSSANAPGGVFYKGKELFQINERRARYAVRGRHELPHGSHRASDALERRHSTRVRGPRQRLHPAAQPARRHVHAHRRRHDRVHARR